MKVEAALSSERVGPGALLYKLNSQISLFVKEHVGPAHPPVRTFGLARSFCDQTTLLEAALQSGIKKWRRRINCLGELRKA